jgi:protein SCO1/2
MAGVVAVSEAPRPPRRRAPIRGAVVGAALLVLLWGYAQLGPSPKLFGTPLGGQPAPSLDLKDERGGEFHLDTLRGRAVLVYFGYTHCTDICPATLAALNRVVARLGPDARRVSIVFVTLDPDRDTGAALRSYLAAFHPTPVGLTGAREQIAAVARSWGVNWTVAEQGAYMDHDSFVALVDPEGRLRTRYGFSQLGREDEVAGDIGSVLRME